jgi:UDP-N-acetylmuramoyl-L-alanyl-D-glutamate--2,6-diaminopimelate ligase
MAYRAQTSSMILAQLLPMFALPESVAAVLVSGLSIDSRQIVEGNVFVAVQGVHSHGADYIDSAIKQGAVAVLMTSSEEQLTVAYQHDVPLISVPFLNERLSDIAGRFYAYPTKAVYTIGVTGTNGKTTCSLLYAQLSALAGSVCGVVGTMGYGSCSRSVTCSELTDLSLMATGMTTPDAIRTQAICAELVSADSHNIVMEVSSHGLDQGRVSAIDFDVAIFTNLTHDHLDYHGSMERYGEAKAALFTFPSLSLAVINIDDPFSSILIAKIKSSLTVVTYSTSNPAADIFLSSIRYASSKTHALLHTREGVYSFSTSLVGRFNLSNLLAVLGAFYGAKKEAVSEKEWLQLIELIKYVKPISGRMELIDNQKKRQVIVDYAHTPDALENVLRSITEYCSAKVWCVFGCGGDRDKEKREKMAVIAERYAHYIIVTTDNPRNENPQSIVDDICRGFIDSTHSIMLDREQAISQAIAQSSENDVVLIAGKGHEDYQLVGDKRLPFSDQSVARLALRKLESVND